MTEPEQNTGLLLFYPYRAMETRVLAALAAAGHEVTLAQARSAAAGRATAAG